MNLDLTQIEKPFGLLDQETQDALMKHGGPYQRFYSDGWGKCGNPQWYINGVYRVDPNTIIPEVLWVNVYKDSSGFAHSIKSKAELLCKDKARTVKYVSEDFMLAQIKESVKLEREECAKIAKAFIEKEEPIGFDYDRGMYSAAKSIYSSIINRK
jgi:hypothetical protein